MLKAEDAEEKPEKTEDENPGKLVQTAKIEKLGTIINLEFVQYV